MAMILITRPPGWKAAVDREQAPSEGHTIRAPLLWDTRSGHIFRSRLLACLALLEAFSVDIAAEMRL